MNSFLTIEKPDVVKRLTAAFIDLLIVISLGLILFNFVVGPIFDAATDAPELRSYKESVEVVKDTETQNGYNLNLGSNETYDKYVKEAKRFFEYYEEKLTDYYYNLALNDKNCPEEFKERFKDIELIYNVYFCGLKYNPVVTENEDGTGETSYSNKYFIYQFDKNANEYIWGEYAIDNEGYYEELNERYIVDRQGFCAQKYDNLKVMLSLIDEDYKNGNSSLQLYTNLNALFSTVVSILIIYAAIPYCFGNFATIGKKIFGYGYINKNGTKLSWYKGLCKTLCCMVLPALGLYLFNIYTLVFFAIAPYFVNLMFLLLGKSEADIFEKVFRMRMIDVKKSSLFETEEELNEFLKSEYDENYTQEEIDYTNALANMEVLDLKGIEEKIEDEKRSTSNETKK